MHRGYGTGSGPAEVAIDVGRHVVYAAVTGAIYELLD